MSKKSTIKKTATKKVDLGKVNAMKEKSKQKAERKAKPAPEKPAKSINGIENPIIATPRLKRAMAVALGRCESDKKKLAELIVKSGIVYRQAVGGKVPETALNKNEWGGTPYANWALKHSDSYFANNQDKVNACREYAEALSGKKMNTKVDDSLKKPETEKKAKTGTAKVDKKVKKNSIKKNVIKKGTVTKVDAKKQSTDSDKK